MTKPRKKKAAKAEEPIADVPAVEENAMPEEEATEETPVPQETPVEASPEVEAPAPPKEPENAPSANAEVPKAPPVPEPWMDDTLPEYQRIDIYLSAEYDGKDETWRHFNSDKAGYMNHEESRARAREAIKA
jgi:hypothetical protein